MARTIPPDRPLRIRADRDAFEWYLSTWNRSRSLASQTCGVVDRRGITFGHRYSAGYSQSSFPPRSSDSNDLGTTYLAASRLPGAIGSGFDSLGLHPRNTALCWSVYLRGGRPCASPGTAVGRADIAGAVQAVLQLIFLQATDSEIATSPQGTNFFIQVSAGGMFCSLMMVVLLLRPVFERGVTSTTCLARARKIIDEYGCDPLDEFALLPDKHFFFASNERSFLAYALWRNFAVCLVGPIGPSEDWLIATEDFLLFCAAQDWHPVFYFARSELRPILSQCGLKSFKVGEDARLSVADFNLKGGKFQNLRTACNKARKEGKELRWYQPVDGRFDYGLEAQLKVLSDEWLQAKKGTEMAFDLGSFNLDQIRKRGVATIFDPDSRLIAFATWLPYKQQYRAQS